MSNIDKRTVDSFGDEWSRFDQDALGASEHKFLFDSYFHIFPWDSLPENAEGFDMGCGSGRWAKMVAPRVGTLNCIDPSPEALQVAKRGLVDQSHVNFYNAGVSDGALPAGSQDFGYSLGVLHHIPDTRAALKDCVKFLKPGAPFLLYLYYRFDNKPVWYSMVWKMSDLIRRVICHLPPVLKSATTDIIAALVYFPLGRIARLAEKLGLKVDNWLLSSYRNSSFYSMRTDSRDRFGTPLEQRFTRNEIEEMMLSCGLENIEFSDRFPFWCAVGKKTKPTG